MSTLAAMSFGPQALEIPLGLGYHVLNDLVLGKDQIDGSVVLSTYLLSSVPTQHTYHIEPA